MWASDTNRYSGTLPATGTYNVVISGHPSVSGPYSLAYVRGSSSVSNGILTSGQSYNGTVASNGIESFQFSGTSGQGILLYAGASYNTTISVYRPDGSLWGSDTNRYSGALPAMGTYTVVVTGTAYSNYGPYRLDFVRGAGNVSDGMLISGSTRSGVVQPNGIESYKISGVAGNTVSVTSVATYNRTLRLYNPDGSLWISGSASLSGTLPTTGEYTFALVGYALSNYGPYTITLTTPPAPVPASTPSKIGAENLACSVGLDNYAGNPINFDAGFKKQTETDYDAGGLNFTRIYRSDSTWTDNTIGAFWRHNYARTLTVSGSAAEIIDGTGATTNYTLSGSDWVPDDPDTTATIETAGTDYIYILPDNTVEKYDSNKRLTRIEYLGGGALNLAYMRLR